MFRILLASYALSSSYALTQYNDRTAGMSAKTLAGDYYSPADRFS